MSQVYMRSAKMAVTGLHARSATCVLLAAVLSWTTSAGHAQSYPNKPVRFIVPFAPGGGSDIIARVIGKKLAERGGFQVVVDNRGGAGGNIAAETTARAAPDGYTIFQLNVANAIAVSINTRLGYDPVKDFDAVTQLASASFILTASPAIPARNAEELIALARAQPKKLNYASSGSGGSTHLAMELLKSMAKIDVVHIPYTGAGPALNDLISGQVQLFFVGPAASLPHVRSGRLRAIGVSSLKRNPLMSDVPTIAESGVPGYESSAWYGVVVPARTPRAIVAKLNTEIVRILREQDVVERMSALGVDLVSSTPDGFAAFIKSEIIKWGRIVKASGAKVD